MTKQSNRFADLKYLMIVLSLVIALGLWNAFAAEGNQDTSGQSAAEESGTILPTLIPLSDIALPEKPKQAEVPGQESDDLQLREVSQPNTEIVQKKPPVVEQVSLGGSAPAANNGGDSSSPAPVTSTASS
jgi:hypothetical protein